ncbi:hypothetical protein [Mycobacterium terramassiliense]|uniref:hypothetical protein n=1 Tax=Mycobacterium terramassiliense TaxID=1841859 RepID=UPI00097D99E1|nr:hypothetical protein [Mycobacterium terramassiliense]
MISAGESLLDTFPGRLFIEDMRSFGGLAIPERLVRAAAWSVSGYLYSDRWLDVAGLDVDDPELRAYDAAGLAALSGLTAFGSPQIHQGTLTEWRAPNIRNREPLSALPNGAFWTSTPITDGEDTWTLCGENLKRESPRWEVHFDAKRVRVARIDSAGDWAELIDSHSATAGGCKYPDWPAIAESWDAVHLSPAGLLLAHPKISDTPFDPTDASGRAHSEAGRYASVAHWSAVSTAWLRVPPDAEARPALVTPIDSGQT